MLVGVGVGVVGVVVRGRVKDGRMWGRDSPPPSPPRAPLGRWPPRGSPAAVRAPRARPRPPPITSGGHELLLLLVQYAQQKKKGEGRWSE